MSRISVLCLCSGLFLLVGVSCMGPHRSVGEPLTTAQEEQFDDFCHQIWSASSHALIRMNLGEGEMVYQVDTVNYRQNSYLMTLHPGAPSRGNFPANLKTLEIDVHRAALRKIFRQNLSKGIEIRNSYDSPAWGKMFAQYLGTN